MWILKSHTEIGEERHKDCAGVESGLDSTYTGVLVLLVSRIKQGETSCDWQSFPPMVGESKANSTKVEMGISFSCPLARKVRRDLQCNILFFGCCRKSMLVKLCSLDILLYMLPSR